MQLFELDAEGNATKLNPQISSALFSREVLARIGHLQQLAEKKTKTTSSPQDQVTLSMKLFPLIEALGDLAKSLTIQFPKQLLNEIKTISEQQKVGITLSSVLPQKLETGLIGLGRDLQTLETMEKSLLTNGMYTTAKNQLKAATETYQKAPLSSLFSSFSSTPATQDSPGFPGQETRVPTGIFLGNR